MLLGDKSWERGKSLHLLQASHLFLKEEEVDFSRDNHLENKDSLLRGQLTGLYHLVEEVDVTSPYPG
jgi:hypothetical protein